MGVCVGVGVGVGVCLCVCVCVCVCVILYRCNHLCLSIHLCLLVCLYCISSYRSIHACNSVNHYTITNPIINIPHHNYQICMFSISMCFCSVPDAKVSIPFQC